MQVFRFYFKDLLLVMGGVGYQSFGMVLDDFYVENSEMGEGDLICYGV